MSSNTEYKSTCLTSGHVDSGTFYIVDNTLSLNLFVEHNLFKLSHRAIQENEEKNREYNYFYNRTLQCKLHVNYQYN